MTNRVCPNPDCGRSIAADADRCKYCGAVLDPATAEKNDDLELPLVCPECGGTIKAGQAECDKCGYRRPAAKADDRAPAPKPGKSAKTTRKPPPKPDTDKAAEPKRTKVIIPSRTKVTPPPTPASKSKTEKKPPPETRKPKPEPAAKKIEAPPEPPTRHEQKAIDDRKPAEPSEELPPPPGLDDGYLPERPADLPAEGIHVFLRGLQWAAKPMDYPTLIKNMRQHKIGPADYVYAGGKWRTLADVFNLPEVD
jgi:hypothetical protein